MPRQRRRLMGDALHHITIRDDAVGVMIDDREAVAIETLRQHLLADGGSNAVGKSLPERTGRRRHAGCHKVLRMPRRPTAPLPEVHQLLHRQIVARQVEQRIEQHRSVAGRKDEAVAVVPVRIGGIMAKELLPQDVCHGRGAHRKAGMAAFCFLNRIDSQKTDRVDGFLVDACVGERVGR